MNNKKEIANMREQKFEAILLAKNKLTVGSPGFFKEAWKDRLFFEYFEVASRLYSLYANAPHTDIMRRQAEAMEEYKHILYERMQDDREMRSYIRTVIIKEEAELT